MSPRQLAYVVSLVLFLCSGVSQAQTLVPTTEPVLTEGLPVSPMPTLGCLHWDADIVLGLPTLLRLQRDLIGNEQVALRVEGAVGFELIFPAAGLGLRSRLMPFAGRHDCFQMNPGIDAYILANPFPGGGFFGGGPPTIGFYTADIDFVWQHEYANNCHGACGMKLGAGVSDSTGRALPVVGVFAGIRF